MSTRPGLTTSPEASMIRSASVSRPRSSRATRPFSASRSVSVTVLLTGSRTLPF